MQIHAWVVALLVNLVPPPTPAAGQPSPLDSLAERAVTRTLAVVESMPRGRERELAAAALAYRLLARNWCGPALPVLNKELIADSNPSDLDRLAMAALGGRDVRCMAWVAARIDKVRHRPDLAKSVRTILEVRAATLFNVIGELNRATAARVETEPSLAFVPEADKHETLLIDGLSIQLQLAGRPTVGERLLLDQLDAYRGTLLFKPLLLDLARRAALQPKLLTSGGWSEVALGLLGAGDEAAASALLAKAGIEDHYTLKGLQAELELRAKHYGRAASLMTGGTYYRHDEQLYALMREQPMALLPHLHDDSFWEGPPDDVLHLASYSEALDKAGEAAAAEQAALEMLTRAQKAGRTLAPNRTAQMAARLGRLAEARAQLATTAGKGMDIDPLIIRRGIAVGLAQHGDREALAGVAAEIPPRQRIWLLGEVVTQAAGARLDLLTEVAAQLAALLADEPSVPVSEAWMEKLAASGIDAAPLLAIVRAAPDPAKRASLALAAAQGAAAVASDAVTPLGQEARRQFGGAIPDPALQALARLYAISGHGELALQAAEQSRMPLARVMALTEIVRPRIESANRWAP